MKTRKNYQFDLTQEERNLLVLALNDMQFHYADYEDGDLKDEKQKNYKRILDALTPYITQPNKL